jgi:hypothetical protein
VLSAEIRWGLSALLAAFALHFADRGGTPVDAAMPFVGVVIVFLAWRCSALIEACVPLLVAAAIAFPEERVRLFAFGVIVAGAFAAAAATVPRRFADCAALTIAAVLVLRWIPLSNVEVFRELIVLLGALAVLFCGGQALLPVLGAGGTGKSACPPLIVGALAVALVTPTHPGKALLYPFLVAAIVFLARSVPVVISVSVAFLAAAHFARAEHAPLWVAAAVAVAMPLLERARLALPAYVAAIALFVLWPWSGLVGRAMPNFFRAAPPSPRARTIGVALAASQSIDVAVPPGTTRAIVVASGANVARLKEGRAIGSVNDTPIRIGDVADFGFMRREQFFMARNPLPARPVADIRGYGQAAFLYGAGFVVVPGAESLHISAAADLPANARLQVESVDFE